MVLLMRPPHVGGCPGKHRTHLCSVTDNCLAWMDGNLPTLVSCCFLVIPLKFSDDYLVCCVKIVFIVYAVMHFTSHIPKPPHLSGCG